MARLLITNSDNDLFIQMDWVDNIGTHTKRVTEEMPPAVQTAAQTLIDWANTEEVTTYAPLTEVAGERQRISQEIGRLQARLAQLGNR